MVLEAKKFIGDSLTCPSRVLHLPGMCHMLLVYCSIDYINLCKGCVPKKLLKETLVHLSPSTDPHPHSGNRNKLHFSTGELINTL